MSTIWGQPLLRLKKISIYLILFYSFPGSSDGKESACNAGGLGSIPGLRRSTAEGNGNPIQYSCLENPMDRPWGHKQLDTSEWLTLSCHIILASTPNLALCCVKWMKLSQSLFLLFLKITECFPGDIPCGPISCFLSWYQNNINCLLMRV